MNPDVVAYFICIVVNLLGCLFFRLKTGKFSLGNILICLFIIIAPGVNMLVTGFALVGCLIYVISAISETELFKKKRF